MKKSIILVLLLIINIGFINAQVELKGKKLQVKLDLINSEINLGNYDRAIDIFTNKDSVILENNVKKKELAIFLKNDSIIQSKIIEINELKGKMSKIHSLLIINRFFDAIDLFYTFDDTILDWLKTDKDYKYIKTYLTMIDSLYVKQIEYLGKAEVSPFSHSNSIDNYFYGSDLSDEITNTVIYRTFGKRVNEVDKRVVDISIAALNALRDRVKLTPPVDPDHKVEYLINYLAANGDVITVDPDHKIDYLINVRPLPIDNKTGLINNKYINPIKELYNSKFDKYIKSNNAIKQLDSLTYKLNPNNLTTNKFSTQIDYILSLKNSLYEYVKNELDFGQNNQALLSPLNYLYIPLINRNGDIYNKIISNFISELEIDKIPKENYDLTISRLQYIKKINKSIDPNSRTFIGVELDEKTKSLVENKIKELISLNPYREDMSKPIPNSKRVFFDYILKNCLSIENCDPQIIDVLNLDIYRYYNLSSYNTPLKKQVFETSDEYKKYMKNIQLKKTFIEKSNFIVVNTYTDNLKYFHDNLSKYLISGNYSLSKHGFTFRFNGINENDVELRYSPNNREFRCGNGSEVYLNLSSTQIPLVSKKYFTGSMLYVSYDYGEEMFIPLNKTDALEIENDPTPVVVCFIAIDKIRAIKWLYKTPTVINTNENYGMLSTDKVRMIVLNINTGKIYFDKIY